MDTLVNVAYCASHWKGNKGLNPLHGQTHAEWLEKSLELLSAICDFPLLVSATGWPGICHVETSPENRERDAMWRILRVADLIGMPQNPSHQEGAAWCIRQGLEFAHKMGFKYLIHTAEDIVPHDGALQDIRRRLRFVDYVGELWGPERAQLSSQFFGCRVEALVGEFDPPAVNQAECLEAYLSWLLRTAKIDPIEQIYMHTHDYAEWLRWARV